MMRKILPIFAIVVIVIVAAFGCKLSGPSDRDVIEAMEAVMRGFETSMHDDSMEVQETYSNAADAVFKNADETVVTSMTGIFNDNRMHVYGTSIFSEYQDPATDYQLDGEFSYNIKSLNAYRANSWFGEMDCSVELTGGKVETLEFSFLIGENGEIEEYFISANDIDLDLDKPNSTVDILERFIRKMPG